MQCETHMYELPVCTRTSERGPKIAACRRVCKHLFWRVDMAKKLAKRGQPSSKAANDYCRSCACNLRVKFGDFPKTSYVSMENLFQSTKREGSKCNKTLVELYSQIGLHVANSTALSDGVCRSCRKKIRNAFQLYTFIKGSLQKALPQDTPSQDFASKDSTSVRFKRLLPSSVLSPDWSPRPKHLIPRITELS